MSIKEQFLTRNEVYTIYSSEKQERMKVYFKLTEKFKACENDCNRVVNQQQDELQECSKQCDKIYDEYKEILAKRYEGENKDRIFMEVKNSQLFTTQQRKDKDNLFYKIFGY